MRPDAGSWPHERAELPRAQVWWCPDQATFDGLIEDRDPAPPAGPPVAGDPLAGARLEGPAGLRLYERVLRKVSRKARVTPLLFDRIPPPSPEQRAFLAADHGARAEFKALWSARGHKQWAAIRRARNGYDKDKERLRHLVLRDGYVWSDHPDVARYLWRGLSLRHLFDEPVIYLSRGDLVSRLERDDDDYHYADGARAGARARLTVFDRVALRPEDLRRRHGWDLDAFRRSAGLRTFGVTEHRADLLRGTARQRGGRELAAAALFSGGERRLVLLVAPEARAAVRSDLAADARREAMLEGLMVSAEQMADEQLTFDEPRTELGQQDGRLRNEWLAAYARGDLTYHFNGDRYPVFTREGRPRPPQVCIDFVMDIQERWSGRWWAPKGEKPARSQGFLDLGDLEFNRRQVSSLLTFAREHPDIIDLYTVPPKQRVPFELRSAFYHHVDSLSAVVEPADTVVIFGLRADERNHWHAFDVYATDPIHGVPYLLVAQAGTANIQVWDDVMRSAPKRSIRYRVRFRPQWLVEQHRLAGGR